MLRPHITVMIPVYNEESYLPDLMRSLEAQSYPKSHTEIIIIDGHSTDQTPDMLKDYEKTWDNLLVLNNPKQIVPSSLNLAISQATGQYLIRWDAHTKYDPDYNANCVAALEETQADNVGGPIRLIGDTPVRQAIKLATTCPFGIGNSQFHYENYEGQADTVYLGAFQKAIFDKVGGFDEELVRNQDDELNYRIILSGGSIYLTPKIRSFYYPRDSLKKLWKQYYQYGYWKVRVIQKHKKPASLRHLIPGVFVFSLLLGLALAPVYGVGLWLLIPTVISYSLALVFFTFKTSWSEKYSYFWILGLVFSILHLSYGLGFLKGALDFQVLKKHLKA